MNSRKHVFQFDTYDDLLLKSSVNHIINNENQVFDALNAVTGPYANRLFVDNLGANSMSCGVELGPNENISSIGYADDTLIYGAQSKHIHLCTILYRIF